MNWTIENRLPERTRVAWFVLDDVVVRDTRPELQEELAVRAQELRTRYPDPASAAPVFAASRRLYHGLGLDPSKTRPSSEALVRRILQGKGLFSVNTAVDAANLTSITHHRPVGLYDAGRIAADATGSDAGKIAVDVTGPGSREYVAEAKESAARHAPGGRVTLRLGREGEQYPGIGKEMIHLAGRPTLVDLHGPFGNPSSDSDRTKVTLDTRSLLYVLFEPAEEPEAEVILHLALSREIMLRHVGGTAD